MTVTGMMSYGSLCGNELWNMERTSRYIENGLAPSRFEFLCTGCPGLQDLLPCLDPGDKIVTAPATDYTLPELDPAPWYDANLPESRNFAGLYILDVTMSAPYSRVSTPNIGDGATLGRLKRNGRTITVKGVLVGKTCCSVEYGLRWLTSALDSSSCVSGDCDGCDFNYLSCCPYVGDEDSCLTKNGVLYMRPSQTGELQRAQDFWRSMHHVGVVSGPELGACVGASCGCGCASIQEVTFTLFAGSPYIYKVADKVVDKAQLFPCNGQCAITWRTKAQNAALPAEQQIDCMTGCLPAAADCLDDPNCPLPALPPQPTIKLSDCGCLEANSATLCYSASPQHAWGDSTLNLEIYSGTDALRNVLVYVYQNPKGLACSPTEAAAKGIDQMDTTNTCVSCLSYRVSYIPANSTFRFSGEDRTVTITCDGNERNAAQNIYSTDGGPFDWPDIACAPVCICVEYPCNTSNNGGTVTVERVDRDL